MNHSLILQGSRTQLVNQLVYFDEEKTNFLNQYFPDHNQKRSMVDRVLSVYSATIEKLLADFNEKNLNSVALIGSKLELRYLDDHSSESFTIVFPHRADPDKNMVSFLSPLGFQLLMAQINETYLLEVPSGEISVRVEGIKFVNCGDVN